MSMSDKAILTIGDQRIELPVLVGTEASGPSTSPSCAIRPD